MPATYKDSTKSPACLIRLTNEVPKRNKKTGLINEKDWCNPECVHIIRHALESKGNMNSSNYRTMTE